MNAPELLAKAVEVVPVDSITPHPSNPNEGDQGAIGESIDAVGFYSTIYVQRSTNRILAGEHRWRALRERGGTEAPVVFLDVDDETALRILIADNEIPRRTSRADDSALAALLVDLQQQTERGIVGTGWDGSGLDLLLADLNTVPYHLHAGEDAPARLDGFNASEIRQVVLILSIEQFDRVVPILRDMREATGAESNTDCIVALIEEWNANHLAG